MQFITSPAYAELKEDLHAAGLEYCFNAHGVGAMLPDGRSLILSTDHADKLSAVIPNLRESILHRITLSPGARVGVELSNAYPFASFSAASKISAQPFSILSAAALLVTELVQV